MARTKAATVLHQCASQVGYREGRNNYNKYAAQAGHANYQAWCATFLVAEFRIAGQSLPSGASTAGCYYNCRAFKNANRFSYYPAVGAIFFLGASGSEHTGIVYKYDSTYVYTYEGNTNNNGSPQGNGVYARRRTRHSVYGYGYPDYSDKIVSADPKWGGHNSGGSSHSSSTGFPGSGYFGPGKVNAYVTELGKMLVGRGGGKYYNSGPGPRWTADADGAATAAFQRAQGWSGSDADGIPGPGTWSLLKAGTGHDIPGAKAPKKKKPWIWSSVGPGQRNNSVKIVQNALIHEHCSIPSGATGYWGRQTTAAYAEWQRKLGYHGRDADGRPGTTSLNKLSDAAGFDIHH